MATFKRLFFGIAVAIITTTGAGCGNEDNHASTPPVADRFDCEAYVPPPRIDRDRCADVDADSPARLRRCEQGSGYLGTWGVDDAGLPAYDFAVDQRCDPLATAYSPRATPLRDPIHLIGNGRGLVAMAHASGAIEIYSQDRGHKWINHVDLWSDPTDPTYPPQLAGGFNYYVVHAPDGSARIGSTRFEDLPTNRALAMQTRRFGVGYYETVTRDADIELTRRTFAPDADARALVSEVTVTNPTDRPQHYELVEVWDINEHQLPVELITSDISFPGTTERIDRRRRTLAASFNQHLEWDAAAGVARVDTTAKSLPAAVPDRDTVSRVDYFPEPIYLAMLDAERDVTGVWLNDEELWSDSDRRPPAAIAGDALNASRAIDIDGAGQHALLAIRVRVDVAAHQSTTRRFAFGYVPGGGSPYAAIAELRQRAPRLASDTDESWRRRLVWAAFPDLPRAGAVQRELAWAAYNAIAHTTFDEYRGVRLLGQGGSYKYIHGIDGAMGDLALFAEAMTLVDPAIAADTLSYALASQMSSRGATPWRFPYATTGVGNFSDVAIYTQRSDAYFFLPTAIARYVALTRDTAFLDRQLPYWPRSDAEHDSVLNHLRRTMQYTTDSLGIGARGLVAMGTGDYADGVLALTDEPTTPTGTSSTYNAGMVIRGFPLAADVVASRDATLAQSYRDLATSQADAILNHAWSGSWYHRGFVDSGNPLAPDYFFLEPQLFPMLAGIVDNQRRDLLLDEIGRALETDIGAVSNVAVGETGPIGGPDQPLVGGIWPVANAWLTEAYAQRDAERGWDSFVRNTLAAHADAYPSLWYGIWTGPDSFNGPESARPGEADAHAATALTDFPALNAHMHTSPLRALMGLLGVEGTSDGLRITPRVPTETFSVHWPRLGIESQPTSMSGYVVTESDGPLVLDVALPSRLSARARVTAEIDGRRESLDVVRGRVRISLVAARGLAAEWSLR